MVAGYKSDEEAKKLMKQLTPAQLGVAKTLTLNKLELEHLRRAVAVLQEQYDSLYKIMLVVLDAQPDRELRIHETQFLRFKEEYRIDRTFGEESKEVVLKLKTLTDD